MVDVLSPASAIISKISIRVLLFSRTPDWDFHFFNHMRYSISHTIEDRGTEIKNEQPHVGRTSIHNVIVMFKLHHHVAS